MWVRFLSVVSVGILAGLAVPATTYAQTFTASLQGSVSDSTGAVVPNARVLLINDATNVRQERKTDTRGVYLFPLVPPGSYKLTVEMTGFQTAVRAGVVLQVQQQATVDIVMTVGDVTSSVVVAAEVPRLDSVSATLGRVIENASVQSMPILGRNILSLANLTPGVVGTPGGTGTNFMSNGTRNSQSDVLVDGVTVAVMEQGGGATDVKFRPTVEAIQEFKIQTNSFSAEYGFTGGAVVTAITRSGTNQVHGSAFDFLRNNVLNANNFFSNRLDRPLTGFRQNQFGGAVGGPVYIPKVYDGRDKTFFFFHYEAIKTRQDAQTFQNLPSLLERNGDFSDTRDAQGRLLTVYDPFNLTGAAGSELRAAFPNNVIPASRFSPVAVAALKFYPEPNQAGLPFTHQQNFYFAGASKADNYQSTSKIDHNFSQNRRLSVRYSLVRSTSRSPNPWNNPMSTTGNSNVTNTNNPSVDYTHTFSPTTVMSVRWGLSRQYGDTGLPCGECSFTPSSLGIGGPWASPIPPQFAPAGFQTIGPGRFTRIRRGEDVNHFNGNVSKSIGRHFIKFGAESRLYRLNYGQPGMNHVTFSFARNITQQNPRLANNLQGIGLASMLLGWGTGDEATDAPASWAYQSHGAFYQHDMKLTPKLTLNFGLRYELPIPEKERYNRASWFNTQIKAPISVPEFPNLRGGLEFALNGNEHRSPHDTDKNNWAPRIGFAWQFLPKMVMRGGYGVYYGVTRAQISSPLGPGFRTGTPWASSIDGNNLTLFTPLTTPFRDGLNQPVGGRDGLSTFIGLSTGIAPIRDWDTTPYFQQWSYSIERETPWNSVVEVAYSGSRGVHLGYDTMTSQGRIPQSYYSLGNQLTQQVRNPFFGVITNPVATVLNKPTVQQQQLLVQYPQYTNVGAWPAPPIADSVYHAIQLKFTKRYSGGMYFSGHYTFAKLLDNNSLASSGQSFLGGQTGIQHYDNTRLEWATSIRDITHRAVMDFAYELPIGKGRAVGANWHRAVDIALGNWQVNGIMIFQSGNPLAPALSGGILPGANQRPNLLFEAGRPGSIQERLEQSVGYLDPSGFSRPAPYTFGTAPRTMRMRGPGIASADMSLFKNIVLHTERQVSLQIRAEAFNITNTPQFNSPNITFGDPNFGLITGGGGQRNVQLALKLTF